jgi:hypothetical protein
MEQQVPEGLRRALHAIGERAAMVCDVRDARVMRPMPATWRLR